MLAYAIVSDVEPRNIRSGDLQQGAGVVSDEMGKIPRSSHLEGRDTSYRQMIKRFLLALGLLLIAAPALAQAPSAPTACAEQFLERRAPALQNPKLAAKTRELCYSAFAVLHSGITRTPLYSAERLTRQRLDAARGLQRENVFHPDPHLPIDERAELYDYARSGFDRGHLAPAADMPNIASQNESFSLANMIPQNPENNRKLWDGIERSTRDLALRDGEIYVVTGPIFQGETLQRLRGRVLVPTGIFKAIYSPKHRAAAAYIASNTESERWEVISIAQLRQRTGIDVFPTLSESVKSTVMDLPAPRMYSKSQAQDPGAGWEKLLRALTSR